jgi:hypothetical protein
MRKMMTFLMLILPLSCFAPENNVLIMLTGEEIKPFETLLKAVSTVESNGDNYAVNEKEGAYGALQIRQCRLDHFFQLTGKRYTLTDMFDYEKAKEVFLYFADMFGPYQMEKAAKRWNGSGPMVEIYWNKVKQYL